MAFSRNLALSSFWGLLKINSIELSVHEPRQTERTGGADFLTASMGEPLWRGTVTATRRAHVDAHLLNARLRLAERPGSTFRWTPTTADFQVDDPQGTVLGAASVSVVNVKADGDLVILGVPTGYSIAGGRFLSFNYGSGPARWALHQVMSARTSTGPGDDMELVVQPPVRVGWQAGDAVTLHKPTALAAIVPESARYGVMVPGYGEGISFDFIQRLKPVED